MGNEEGRGEGDVKDGRGEEEEQQGLRDQVQEEHHVQHVSPPS